MKKVLLLDNVHDIIPSRLTDYGFQVISGEKLNKDAILKIIYKFTGIIIRSRITIDKEIIDAATNLKFIARVGAGMESIDLDYCKKQKIICLNSPEGNRDAVGEHTIGMLLSLLNNLNKSNAEVKNGIWNREENRGIELNNITVGIIGYGNMGGSFARKLSGFNCRVLSYDKYKTNYADEFTIEVNLQTIFDECDVLSLHTPLTEETHYMINDNFISNFKNPFILINTARGPVVNTKALVKALKNKKILAAALDVIEYEESSFETTKSMLKSINFRYLAASNNVIMTPHIAGWTVESKIKLAEVLVEKILNLKIL